MNFVQDLAGFGLAAVAPFEILRKISQNFSPTGVTSPFMARNHGAGDEASASNGIRHLVERIELADQVSFDVFGVGEHHRKEFLDSAPTLILAAAAARTQRIRLTSAVTVLSAADPVAAGYARSIRRRARQARRAAGGRTGGSRGKNSASQ